MSIDKYTLSNFNFINVICSFVFILLYPLERPSLTHSSQYKTDTLAHTWYLLNTFYAQIDDDTYDSSEP